MDYYMQEINVVNRLKEEWDKHGRLIVAYDFDNTVYDYHKKGLEFNDVIELLRDCHELGASFIVFTAADRCRHDGIRTYLNENNIPYTTINENLSYIKTTGRKVYYNILLDDRAGLCSAYHCLKAVVRMKKKEQMMKREVI